MFGWEEISAKPQHSCFFLLWLPESGMDLISTVQASTPSSSETGWAKVPDLRQGALLAADQRWVVVQRAISTRKGNRTGGLRAFHCSPRLSETGEQACMPKGPPVQSFSVIAGWKVTLTPWEQALLKRLHLPGDVAATEHVLALLAWLISVAGRGVQASRLADVSYLIVGLSVCLVRYRVSMTQLAAREHGT
jgi:hypothetical protein